MKVGNLGKALVDAHFCDVFFQFIDGKTGDEPAGAIANKKPVFVATVAIDDKVQLEVFGKFNFSDRLPLSPCSNITRLV